MNVDWALKQLTVFIESSEMRYPAPTPGVVDLTGRKVTAASNEELTKQSIVVEQIFDRVIPSWKAGAKRSNVNQWMHHRNTALRVKEALVRDVEIKENLGENAPELSAAKMHPWIWSGAKSLWQSGHYREAVEAAIKKLNAETQNKIERRDISEVDLFAQAFSLDAPSAGKSRLRRMPNDGSKTFESMQRGAIHFAKGIFAGIRNPFAHESERELDDQAALEYLAALSVLARWVDDATVEDALVSAVAV